MRKWKTITASVLSALALSVGGALTLASYQPQSYQGELFTNEKTTKPTTKTIQESTTTTNVEQQQPAVGTTPALQPTFEVCYVFANKQDLYYVEHRPTGDKSPMMYEEEAEAFCAYMEDIAHGKEKLDYSMTTNYNTWLTNN